MLNKNRTSQLKTASETPQFPTSKCDFNSAISARKPASEAEASTEHCSTSYSTPSNRTLSGLGHLLRQHLARRADKEPPTPHLESLFGVLYLDSFFNSHVFVLGPVFHCTCCSPAIPLHRLLHTTHYSLFCNTYCYFFLYILFYRLPVSSTCSYDKPLT